MSAKQDYNKVAWKNNNMAETLSFRKASKEPIYSSSGAGNENMRGIICENSISGVVSERYPLIQYNEVHSAVMNAFISQGIDTMGKISLNSKKFYGRYIAKNICISDDTNTGLTCGIDVRTNYTGSGVIAGIPFFERFSCSNGMLTSQIIEGINIKIDHRSDISLITLVNGFKTLLERVLNSSNLWQKVIDSSISQQIEFTSEQECVAFHESIFGSKIKGNEKGKIWYENHKSTCGNAWELYNTITYAVSHEYELSPAIEEKTLLNAEKILTGEITPIAILA